MSSQGLLEQVGTGLSAESLIKGWVELWWDKIVQIDILSQKLKERRSIIKEHILTVLAHFFQRSLKVFSGHNFPPCVVCVV